MDTSFGIRSLGAWDSSGTGAILSPTLVSPKRQRGTTGQGIAEQIQAVGLVISLKPVVPRWRFGLTKHIKI